MTSSTSKRCMLCGKPEHAGACRRTWVPPQCKACGRSAPRGHKCRRCEVCNTTEIAGSLRPEHVPARVGVRAGFVHVCANGLACSTRLQALGRIAPATIVPIEPTPVWIGCLPPPIEVYGQGRKARIGPKPQSTNRRKPRTLIQAM